MSRQRSCAAVRGIYWKIDYESYQCLIQNTAPVATNPLKAMKSLQGIANGNVRAAAWVQRSYSVLNVNSGLLSHI
jgi:hypothetical protein